MKVISKTKDATMKGNLSSMIIDGSGGSIGSIGSGYGSGGTGYGPGGIGYGPGASHCFAYISSQVFVTQQPGSTLHSDIRKGEAHDISSQQ